MLRLVLALCVAAASGFMSPAAFHPTSKVAASKVHMSAVVDEIMEKLKKMTLLEASELVKAIEVTFDEAKDAVEKAPNKIKEGASKADCEAAAAKLKEAGAVVSIK
ncbi:chloroplast 50s ribosomal protein l12 [Chrysochromulina tobinii]|uniref:Chloroplast 50s ribosomal protein l12 n=1 Tax=Chrysochromulina tobinii TaxID=1460289 RepID=A0A0M0J3G3_9EUKA|nr:chloroplast 50s ribosomal protein l12 [Chrysochromulina tobinii]|eukprot:KOO21055.1 chloroplast 50s ribosomal protein l12 [Chrysochromulina sp. CCMP291]